jgi:hypothetical protein
MPITPAHAAAAWPLHRLSARLSTAALVIGTAAPDLEYVLRMAPRGKFGHSAPGLFLFCLPVTLLLWWAWRSAVRPSLVPLLPPRIRAAAEASDTARTIDALPMAVLSALIGAATHIVWDGFTHNTGLFVRIFPFLLTEPWGDSLFPWFAVLQYLSSVVGMIVVVLWMASWWRRWPPEARRFAPGQAARAMRAVLFVAAFSLGAAAVNALFADTLVNRLGRAAVGAMGGFAVALAIYAAWTGSRRTVRAESS